MIRLTLLGGPGLVYSDGQDVQPVLSQPKRLALLAYLALAGPGKFRSRDSVLALFWPDATERRARQSLNQALHFLRVSLGTDVIVSRGPGELGITAETLWCDVVAFDQMVVANDLTDAVHLYSRSGDLLPGFFTDAAAEFDQWLNSERGRLRKAAFTAAWASAELAEKDGRLAAAVEWARIAADLSLNDETTTRNLILMLDRIGDAAGALQAYDAFSALLLREYEILPSADVRELAARIRARDKIIVQTAAPTTASAGAKQNVGDDNYSPRGLRLTDPATASHGGDTLNHTLSIPPNATVTERPHESIIQRRRPRLAHFTWLVVGALLVGAGVVSLSYYASSSSTRKVASNYQASIIVREFASAGQPDKYSRLDRALTSAIIDQLTAVRSFNIISISDTSAVPLRLSGDTRAPAILLSGNVVQSDGRLRVNIQIADARSGRAIKTAALDHRKGDFLPLVDSLSLQISSLVRATVGREIRISTWSIGAKNDHAYALMQQADEHRDRANQLAASGDVSAAVRALQSADSTLVQVESGAPGWREPVIERTELLQTLGAMYLMPPFHDPAKVERSLARGIAEGKHAVFLDPQDAGALEALGSVEYWYWLVVQLPPDSALLARARAEKSLRAAVAADPSRASAWSSLSALLYAQADYTGAYLTADRAYHADAYLRSSETILDELFIASYESGDDSTAKAWCDEINRRTGRGWLSAYCRLRPLASSDARDEYAIARAWRLAKGTTDPGSRLPSVAPQLQMLVGVVIARQGLRDSAESVIRAAHDRGKGDPELVPLEAEALMRLGQPDSAAARLIRYYVARPSHRAGIVRSRTFARLIPLQRMLARMMIPLSSRNDALEQR